MKETSLALLIRIIAYPAAFYLVFSLLVFFLYTHPSRYVSPPLPADRDLKPESVRLRTSDGVELDAWFIPNRKSGKAVIICHGYPMDKGNVLGMAEFLARDFNLLLFDFRAMGGSGGFFSTGGWRETKDVTAAVEFLKAKGFARMGGFGLSLGAATLAMAQDEALKARVLDSSFANLFEELDFVFGWLGPFRHPLLGLMRTWNFLLLGINASAVAPEKFISAVKTPVLLIHGDLDSQVPVSGSLRLHEKNPAAELWIIKGAEHCQTRDMAGAEYDKRVLEFFNKNL